MIDNSLLPEHQRMDSEISITYRNVGELLSKKVNENPNKTFLICPGKDTDRFTYLEFNQMVQKIGRYLIQNKLEKNDKIGIIFHNSPEFLILYFAGLSIGVTIVPINPDMASREIKFIIDNSKCKSVFYANKIKLKIDEIREITDNVKFNGIETINDLIPENDKFENTNSNVSLNDLAVIIYTSGTTGNPKGVKLSHLNLLADAYSISKCFQFNVETRALCILPLFHNNGQITTLLAPLYSGGSTVIVKGKASLYSFWDLVNEYKVTWTSVMASILSILLSLPKERKDKTMIGLLCGGQVLTRAVHNDFEKRFQVPIFEGYGLTETTSFSCINDFPKEKRRLGSIGKSLDTNQMAILDEDGKNVESGIEGEICIRGYNVTEGYLGLKEKNDIAFRNGWFHSGDFGRKDEDGYYYIHGRQDSLIIKGGENIYPAEIENILYQHNDVDECAVIGIPDKLLGEDICAFVKIKTSKAVTVEELKNFCKGKIAGFKQPKEIIIINQLELKDIPKGPTKKVLYKELKKFYLEKFQK